MTDQHGIFIGINGGITEMDKVAEFIAEDHTDPMDGVMMGRAAYQNPSILTQVDEIVFRRQSAPTDLDQVCKAMMDYAANHIANEGRVHHVTRHMIGLFQGMPGARRYRQILSVEASKPDADEGIIRQAFDSIQSALAAA